MFYFYFFPNIKYNVAHIYVKYKIVCVYTQLIIYKHTDTTFYILGILCVYVCVEALYISDLASLEHK